MSTPVEAVLFDVDDTICEYRRRGDEILPEAFEQVGVDPFFTVEEYLDRYREFTEVSETMADLREQVFGTLARERGFDPGVGREVARAYAAERDHTDVRFRPGAREAIDALHGEFPIAVVTNGGPTMQSAKLDALGVADRFETVVHAGYDAPAKPDPEPFHLALDAVSVSPDRAVHVGNSLDSDVAGARAAGVRAAWLRPGDGHADPDPRPDYVLDSLADLPNTITI
jgi:putative hydrolase of the HAD superfamily